MICSLILNFFNVFFPKLLERKVINIFSTPLIRAYPSKKNKYLEEFYNIEEYNEWSAKVNINDYKINYIKGLAGHSNMEIKYMFKEFNKNIYKFKLDEKANDYFEIYFGNDADKRKVILAGKDEYEEEEYKENYKNKIISCSYQLNTNTKEFQLDNIQRKMPHIIDGLNPARRKVLAGSMKKFKQSNNTLKVFQLGGFIAEHMMYHHGSDSLNKTIITMAQNFPGSRNIPLLLPIGQFGSRYKGGDDAGSARYISTKLNKSVVELLYPTIDNDLLEYHIIDGELAEPKYFIPILPTVLLEDISLPSTGWKIEVYARDIEQVINNVKHLINDESSKIGKMKYFKNKFKGKEIKNKNVNMLIGQYEIPKNSKDTIVITELPPKVWNEKFIDSLEKKEFIDDVLDESTIDDVRMIVIFKKGELNKIMSEYQDSKNYSEYLDAIEYYLNLYSKLNHHINLYQINNAVKEYSNYEDVINDWFYIRKDCYYKRIERELILLKYKIIMLENIIRFIENHEKYNISKKSDAIANEILKENNYIELNTTIINNAGLLPNDKLEYNITLVNQSYNYLLNLSYRNMNDNSYNNNKTKLKELKEKLKYYQKKDIYKEIWIEEIDSLYKDLKTKLKNGFYIEDENLFKRK
jgi:DNA topoisomerase-2